uniref:Ovule protein n=1 Tax=Loa loa TaxID=7209 RepID=A0A1I7V6M7_LOALO
MARSTPMGNNTAIVKLKPKLGINCIQMHVRKGMKVIPVKTKYASGNGRSGKEFHQ